MKRSELKQLIKQILSEGYFKNLAISLDELGFQLTEDDADYSVFKKEGGWVATLNKEKGTWSLENISDDQRNVQSYLKDATFEDLEAEINKLTSDDSIEESAPPGFPPSLRAKLLKRYQNPRKAYATMWALHNKMKHKTKNEMWIGW